MTCIIGMCLGGSVYVAADRMASNGFTKFLVDRPKVFRKGDFVIGYTTSFKMGQLLEFEWNPPARLVSDTDEEFIYCKVVKSFEMLFKSLDHGSKSGSHYETGEFLFAYQGKLYKHHPQGFITSSEAMACGAGEYHAVAIIDTLLTHTELSPSEMFRETMRRVSRYVEGVSEDFDYCCLEG